MPERGLLGIVRVYLPAAGQTVDVQWIEIECGARQAQRWKFGEK